MSPATKLIIYNNPNNPSGRMWTRGELDALADAAEEFDAYVVADEVYEHFYYDGRDPGLVLSHPRLSLRAVSISAVSKTFALTG